MSGASAMDGSDGRWPILIEWERRRDRCHRDTTAGQRDRRTSISATVPPAIRSGGLVAGQGAITNGPPGGAGVSVGSGTGDADPDEQHFLQWADRDSQRGRQLPTIQSPPRCSRPPAIDTFHPTPPTSRGLTTSQPSSTFLIQFFSNIAADPAGSLRGPDLSSVRRP